MRDYVSLPIELRSDFNAEGVLESPEKGVVMQVAKPLPDLCSEHGRPAVSRRTNDIRFRLVEDIWVQRTALDAVRELLTGAPRAAFGGPARVWRRAFDWKPDAVLEGDWPVCDRCLMYQRLYRWIGHLLVLAGLPLIYLIFVLWSTGTTIHSPALALAILPGWIPCGLVVALLSYRRSGTFVRIEPISTLVEPTTVLLRADPTFAEAFERADDPHEPQEH